MKTDRLAQLLNFLEEDPKDPFHWYAVGTEYRGEAPEKALPYFEHLFSYFPTYIPTYYILAELLVELGENDRAKVVFEQGIAEAEKAKELKATAELKNAYQNFLFEVE